MPREIRTLIYTALFKGFERSAKSPMFGAERVLCAFQLQDWHRSSDKARMALIGNEGCDCGSKTCSHGSCRWDMNGPRAIIFTCKQLCAETVQIYTRHTQFFFSHMTTLQRFSPVIKLHITDLCICFDDMYSCKHVCWSLFRVLNAMPQLRVLRFSRRIGEHVFELSCPLRNLRGLRELRLEDIECFSLPVKRMDWSSEYSYAEDLAPLARKVWEENLEAEWRRLMNQVTGPKAHETLPTLGLPFKQTGFGRLDSMIRLKIYALVLVKEDKRGDPYPIIIPPPPVHHLGTIYIHDPDNPLPFHSPQERISVLSILLACRQLNEEAYPVYYNNNRFTFRDPISFGKFLASIGKARRHELVDIEVCNLGPLPREKELRSLTDFHLLGDCHKLERLRLQVWRLQIERWTNNPHIRGLRKLKWFSMQDVDETRARAREQIFSSVIGRGPNHIYVQYPYSQGYCELDEEEHVLWAEHCQEIIHDLERVVTGPNANILAHVDLSPQERIKQNLIEKLGKKALKCKLCRAQWDT